MSNIENKIRYGLFNFGETRDIALGSYEYIYKDIVDIKQNFIRLGFHLYEMQLYKYYEDFGYDNFYDCVEKNFGLDKSAVSRCINVWWNFSANDGSSRKMWVDDKYKDYNYSQLSEMLSMSDEQRRNVSPDMTVKSIRDMKKSSRGSAEVATSQQKNYLEGDDLYKLKGAALCNKLKKVDERDSIVLELVDAVSGERIVHNIWADLLFEGKIQKDGGRHIVIRTNSLHKFLELQNEK